MPALDRPGSLPRTEDDAPARDHAATRRLLRTRQRSPHVDRLVRLAADLLGAPSAQVSLLTDDQVLWSVHGVPVPSGPGTPATPAADSLCSVTVSASAPVAVPDTAADPRVAHLPPVVTGGVSAYLGVPLVGSGGEVLGALCVYDSAAHAWSDTDVSTLTELGGSVVAELELRALTQETEQAAARLELALEAADIGSFDMDVTTGRLHWDERLLRLFGYDADTFDGSLHSFNARVHPEDVGRVGEAIEHTIATSGELVTQYRVVRPDGANRWFEARGRVLGDGDGRRLLGVAYDATELRDARERLARLMESMSDAFFSVDRDWRVTYVNRRAEVLLEKRRDELVGADLWEAFPEAVGSLFETSYRTAVEQDEPVSFEAPYDPLGGWYEVSAWPGPDGLSVFFREVSARREAEQARERAYAEREQAVVERERAYAAAEAANQRLQLVADASTRLSASLEPVQVLETLADLVVPSLGQWVAVVLTSGTAASYEGRDATGDPDALRVLRVGHDDPGRQQELEQALTALRLGTDDVHGPGAAVRTGRPDWLPDAGTGPVVAVLRDLGVGSVLSLPLLNRGRAIGALVVGEPARDRLDHGLLESVAGRGAVALDNALLYAAEARRAVTLQRSLLPRELPRVPGVRTARRYIAGAQGAYVGGDWYQGVQVEGGLLLAMGDVMGHGMRSAARMGQLRAIVATLALEGHRPGALLQRLADSCDVLLDLELATLLVAVLDPVSGRLTYASAGHPPPLVVPSAGPAAYLEVVPGPPLGTVSGSYPESSVVLAPGSTVVLFTDGLVEQRGSTLDVGLSRLQDAVGAAPTDPDGLADHVLGALDREYGGDDDVALLVVSWDPTEGRA